MTFILYLPITSSLCLRYHKSAAQLLIRWCLQSGYVTIPKSTNKERIIENSQVFDWRISDEDMLQLVTKKYIAQECACHCRNCFTFIILKHNLNIRVLPSVINLAQKAGG